MEKRCFISKLRNRGRSGIHEVIFFSVQDLNLNIEYVLTNDEFRTERAETEVYVIPQSCTKEKEVSQSVFRYIFFVILCEIFVTLVE